MQPHELISQAIRQGAESGGAMVPFVTAGFPTKEAFPEILEEIAPHADVIEIGVPFSDPMADGMTIQRTSFKAIENGVNLSWILQSLSEVKDRVSTPFVLMSYLNPMLAYGFERLAEDAAAAGVCGFIVPDLPFEESAPLRQALASAGLGLIQLVTPATPPQRLAMLCEASRGFVYAVTVTGITGGGGSGFSNETETYLARVRAASALPVCAGFGVRERADVVRVSQHAHGAIVGSALLEVLEHGQSPGAFLRELRGT
ncbi:MAG: tryptophan synthase subunit alpha [Pseudomonadota bacterium]